MNELENDTSVTVPVHFPLGQLPGEGVFVVRQKVTVPFLSAVNVPEVETVPVLVCPGATLPPALVHSVIVVAVVFSVTVTTSLLPSPASLPQNDSVEPLSVIAGLPMK